MSAWPEAVWIVQQMQKQFQASGKIDYYQQSINSLNKDLNDLKSDFDKSKNSLDTLQNTIVPIVAYEMPPYRQGTIWFVASED